MIGPLGSSLLTLDELEARLAQFPRLSYGALPTPLEPLDNLTRQLNGPRLWIKRDDGVGPGMGGNKGRKLEFLMAEVLDQGRHKVVTFGGLQSNHARMTAAACAGLGLEAHLFFFNRRPPTLKGNLLLNQLFGARLHFVPFGGGGDASMTIELTSLLVRLVSLPFAGPSAYFVPVGGHNVTGCLGYVEAAREVQQQVVGLGLDPASTTVVTAVGTGGTLAGLMAGWRLLGSPMKVLGIDVGRLWKAFPSSIARLADRLCATLHGQAVLKDAFLPQDVPIIEGKYVGQGYAMLTDAAKKAVQLVARQEGILLDPVYTGKAFAGLLDLIRKGTFRPDENVIFLHTGGVPGLWAYADAFAAQATPAVQGS